MHTRSIMLIALTVAAVLGLSASPASAKLCRAPAGYQNFQAVKVTCAKAKKILAKYESGADKSPYGFKCSRFDGEEGSGVLCQDGRRYTSWTPKGG